MDCCMVWLKVMMPEWNSALLLQQANDAAFARMTNVLIVWHNAMLIKFKQATLETPVGKTQM